MFKCLISFSLFGYEFYLEKGTYAHVDEFLDWKREGVDTFIWFFRRFELVVGNLNKMK